MNRSGLVAPPASAGGLLTIHPDAPAMKRAMRERIRAERQTRDRKSREADAWSLAATALEQPEIAQARCVGAYASTPYAPGTQPLRQALRSSGVRILLPVLLDDGQLDWSVDGDDSAPLRQDGIAEAEVVIVPALAVDTLGNRLGHGGGFYDRTLRTIERTVSVFAVVYETEVLDAAIEPVPTEAHDRPVDAVVTPNRCLRMPADRRR
ncbi:MAG TPA: 5-formyltetrahydrofolate cyclo-ligase [Kineosporiaceae bacterium]